MNMKTPAEKLRESAQQTRPSMRPESATDDPRELAALRAKQIRESLGGDMDEGMDEFWIDPDEIPDGWTYEWKRYKVLEKIEHTYQTALLRKGWQPVPASRHPSMMPEGNRGDHIERQGLILMERPKEITDEMRSIELRNARRQVRTKEEQLQAAAPGQFERSNKDNSLVKVRKGHEPMEIPKD